MGSSARLGEKFTSAKQEVAYAANRLAQAESRLEEASSKLGKHLDPGDQEVGETLSLWVRTGFREEDLFLSTKLSKNIYTVVPRRNAARAAAAAKGGERDAS